MCVSGSTNTGDAGREDVSRVLGARGWSARREYPRRTSTKCVSGILTTRDALLQYASRLYFVGPAVVTRDAPGLNASRVIYTPETHILWCVSGTRPAPFNHMAAMHMHPTHSLTLSHIKVDLGRALLPPYLISSIVSPFEGCKTSVSCKWKGGFLPLAHFHPSDHSPFLVKVLLHVCALSATPTRGLCCLCFVSFVQGFHFRCQCIAGMLIHFRSGEAGTRRMSSF